MTTHPAPKSGVETCGIPDCTTQDCRIPDCRGSQMSYSLISDIGGWRLVGSQTVGLQAVGYQIVRELSQTVRSQTVGSQMNTHPAPKSMAGDLWDPRLFPKEQPAAATRSDGGRPFSNVPGVGLFHKITRGGVVVLARKVHRGGEPCGSLGGGNGRVGVLSYKYSYR